ncbi:Alpha-glucosides-binding periplasmic protein AglE precursor [Alloactinosynnema sp. L-07]|uniref:ABC transporter substrate-binding protein n=1 Tax=Alloactinosynnema sp. L-07 TaxID=1653480 RepID=UPI00065F09F6|nr:ABC transporter substrate-binding protein [Alloactinosynnema sp. L-07]CRK56668.1 Alpha-glucosides-binding periplasmic protein AglE precursor [Alloactinosynnema sp. L-07]
MTRIPTLIVLTLVLMANAGLGGCATAPDNGKVTILGSWSGAEKERFDGALAAFTKLTGIQVEYIGTAAVGQVLESEVQKGTPPDIAVLPSPGDLARYRAELTPLDDIVGDSWTTDYSPQWQQLAKAGMDKLYAVPVQANVKGLVWFNTKRPPRPRPNTFQDLMTLSTALAAAGESPWCMGVSAQSTSGWPGTDWIEDVLLHQSGVDVYQKWVAGRLPWTSPQVRQAWTTWGAVVTTPGHVRGGPKAVLLTEFGDAAQPMFGDRPGCMMEHQASFIPGFYAGHKSKPRRGTDIDFFLLPPFEDAHAASRAVSADLAGVFKNTPQARALIRFLVSEQAQREWVAANAYSASTAVRPAEYGDQIAQRIAAELTGPAPLCFDASDLMPTAMRGAFYRAVLEYLSDPSRLDTLLQHLDKIRGELPTEQWLTVACG